MSFDTVRTEANSGQQNQDTQSSESGPIYNPSGGLFRNYALDAGHVQAWVWLLTGLALFFLPGIGFFMLGAVAIGCIHKVDATGQPITPVSERPSGAWLIVRAFGWAILILFALGVLLGLLLVLLF